MPDSEVTQQHASAVVLLSGGLDSTVALALTVQIVSVKLALTFDYGQRARHKEIQASQAIAAHYTVPHQVITLPWLSDILPKSLDATKTHMTGATDPDQIAQDVWVPNRNGVFLNIAASVAEAHQATTIVYGANADEGQNFPDNTPQYRDALNAALRYSTLNGVQVVTPVGHMTKAQMIDTAIENAFEKEVPLHLIWSCYQAGEHHCGACPSCRLLHQALTQKASPLANTLFAKRG